MCTLRGDRHGLHFGQYPLPSPCGYVQLRKHGGHGDGGQQMPQEHRHPVCQVPATGQHEVVRAQFGK